MNINGLNLTYEATFEILPIKFRFWSKYPSDYSLFVRIEVVNNTYICIGIYIFLSSIMEHVHIRLLLYSSSASHEPIFFFNSDKFDKLGLLKRKLKKYIFLLLSSIVQSKILLVQSANNSFLQMDIWNSVLYWSDTSVNQNSNIYCQIYILIIEREKP